MSEANDFTLILNQMFKNFSHLPILFDRVELVELTFLYRFLSLVDAVSFFFASSRYSASSMELACELQLWKLASAKGVEKEIETKDVWRERTRDEGNKSGRGDR